MVVIGGGFIGVEFADECRTMGIERVSVIDLETFKVRDFGRATKPNGFAFLPAAAGGQ